MLATQKIKNPSTKQINNLCLDSTCDPLKAQCKICPKKLLKREMRNNIGYHIIHGDCSAYSQSKNLLEFNFISICSEKIKQSPRGFKNFNHVAQKDTLLIHQQLIYVPLLKKALRTSIRSRTDARGSSKRPIACSPSHLSRHPL